MPLHDNFYILGDFNFYWGESDSRARKFESLVSSMNLKQMVVEPTNKFKHVLDLVITHSDDTLLTNVNVADEAFSDHQAVKCKLRINILDKPNKVRSVRKLSLVDSPVFAKDLKACLPDHLTSNDPAQINKLYTESLTSV